MAPDTYSLRAGPAEKEVERLNAGHDLISRLTGSLLPPQISIDPNAPIRVADIATGTGAWLGQLREHFPASTVLDGFDITNAQFPPQDALPETVKLHIHDMREPFPKELLGSYDIVHVRLIMYALKKDEWAETVKNLATLLKPGGYLVSEDTSYTEWLAIPASSAHCRFLQIDMAFSAHAGRDLTYSGKVLSHFKNAGLEGCTQELYSSFDRPDLYDLTTTLMVRLHELSLKGAIAKGGIEGLRTAEDAATIIDPLKEDIKNGTHIGFAIRRIWGSKAVN